MTSIGFGRRNPAHIGSWAHIYFCITKAHTKIYTNTSMLLIENLLFYSECDGR